MSRFTNSEEFIICISNYCFILLILQLNVFCATSEVNIMMLRNEDDSGFLYETGETIIEPPSYLLARNGVREKSRKWPNGRVPFKFVKRFPKKGREIFNSAANEFYRRTNGCIKFHERTNEEDYILVNHKATACGSFVGRRGGTQMVNFTKWCYMKLGHVLHELLHVLGFYHEQCRLDRDNFVTIIPENIMQGYFKNFQKCQNTTAFGVGYDYYSVLHYDTFSLSKNGKPTIITLNPNYKDKIGQRVSLSEKDVLKLKLMYNCEGTFPNIISE